TAKHSAWNERQQYPVVIIEEIFWLRWSTVEDIFGSDVSLMRGAWLGFVSG
ncbi:hypothetical protein HAX54_050794, partial [Datura stramonium]|nr:hypothetical protein [Datura stramonium]